MKTGETILASLLANDPDWLLLGSEDIFGLLLFIYHHLRQPFIYITCIDRTGLFNLSVFYALFLWSH